MTRDAQPDLPAPTGETSDARPFPVGERDHGERLDRFVAALPDAPSRSQIKGAIRRGEIRVDGESVAKAGYALTAGQTVTVDLQPPETPAALVPQQLQLDVLFEDDHLIVLDKASGMVVHPAPGHPDGTLVNALLHHCGDVLRQVGANGRPGIVHRLDRETSGVMVVAKTLRAHAKLAAHFAAHDIERTYLALAMGGALPDDETITWETLHGRHPRDRKRFTTRVESGRRAVTHAIVRERLGHGTALVACTLETGRTHQIRVHLSEHHAPILGDATYGGRAVKRRPLAGLIDRVALHAAVLGFVHPDTGVRVRFESAPPPDFAAALERLRSAR